jgi:ferredoxin
MCTFCVQHGEGKRWYLNAANYAADLESDLRRRGYMVGFVRDFERNRRAVKAGLGALRLMPAPLRDALAGRASAAMQGIHFGQPVPLEDCERILEIATQVTRLPCVCRGAMRPGSDAESCCLVLTAVPHRGVLDECFEGYRGGPNTEGFQALTREEAIAYLRAAERRGLAHTAWTFLTPFIAAICNCDLPSGCMAMNLTLKGNVRLMWKGEDVARLDAERCSGCAQCVAKCPFGALQTVSKGQVRLDRSGCWGCGTCRSSCARGALALEPRAFAPDVATAW